jgi:hypothetical protein
VRRRRQVDYEVVHRCGHLAIYLMLLDPDLAEVDGAPLAAKDCLLCARKRRLAYRERLSSTDG